MEDTKDKITQAINSLPPERLKKLQELAMSQLTELQRTSYVFESLRDLEMRRIMSRYL
jgi:hypothetical protein